MSKPELSAKLCALPRRTVMKKLTLNIVCVLIALSGAVLAQRVAGWESD